MVGLSRWVVGIILFVGPVVGMVGCSTPTKVYDLSADSIAPLVQSAKKPLVIDSKTIVLDVRPAFQFAMYHIPQARNVTWKEFSQSRGVNINGELPRDLFKSARRLARLGVTPEKSVIVVGQGREGKGEEGRLAWTLFALGINDIQFVDHKYFKARNSLGELPPISPERIWMPKVRDSVVSGRAELAAAVSHKGTGQVHLIDVRAQHEYFNRKAENNHYSLPDLQAVNIEWSEFIDQNGRPNLSMARELKGIGIKSQDSIIVLSNNGIRSGAVTMALLSMGFSKASNFAPGLESLKNH